MSNWIRTDWSFPVRGARMTISVRQLMIECQDQGPMGTITRKFMEALKGVDPDVVATWVKGMVVSHHPELQGCQILAIQHGRPFSMVEVHVAHPSLPECKQGEYWPLMPLIPVQNGVRYWYEGDKLMQEHIKPVEPMSERMREAVSEVKDCKVEGPYIVHEHELGGEG